MSEIIVMIRSEVGMNRVSILSTQTFQEFVNKISQILNKPPESLTLSLDGVVLTLRISPTTPIKNISKFENGAFINVSVDQKKVQQKPQQIQTPEQPKVYMAFGKEANPQQIQQVDHKIHENKDHALSQFCQHGPQAKCINCLSTTSTKVEQQEKTEINKCKHGEGGRCLNCAPYEQEKKNTKTANKILCQHGPNGKCPHCIDEGQIEAKHLSFDQYLHDMKFKCRGQHPDNGRCNNCLPPTMISYKLKKDCKNHAPYPKAMCNNCLPPSILLKRQIYRHVDYVEFLNIPEMSNLVQYWTSKGKTEQRMGFLYGYYAADPNYQNGVRAIVEAIYEPPQKGTFGHVDLLQDPAQTHADEIATNLGMEKIGWIFTNVNHDCFLSSEELRQAARYQQMHSIQHPEGCLVSKFLTVVLRTKKDNPDEVVPEVYMVSDQGQQLEQDGIFQNSERRKVLQVREAKNELDVLPSFVYNGKSVKEFEPDFFIVNVAHGYNPNSNYSILKLYDFPVENRSVVAKQQDLKTFLHKHQKKPSHHRFADFHLLLYLSKLIDIHSIANIAQFIASECEVPNELLDIVKMYATGV
ncbi:unnamed protein product (macronuclear) [Paramecium tetraurelia]|uniref:MPN domain-containing protein n=1 Tax=Paramecium tetraurelia TaxID=5888 RepID=A0BXK4_PARTE|nr:uncharacterized protein GSPATT00033124001 [Paramecium tetraurelia]CAK63271.1 unnamed protein product [Paramecium tetraurelia]|eukprot:XP_001430669.1 hypothetical protein (macronuclear) [Paramecium tetraurelia strain d4-2]